jgi:hypothetical protein
VRREKILRHLLETSKPLWVTKVEHIAFGSLS